MGDVRSATFGELGVTTLYALLKLRVDVFIVEQNCIYPDLDDVDQQARHFWIDDGHRPIAYLRVIDNGDGSVRIGRVVVHPAGRGSGLAKALMDAALMYIGSRPCELNAQAHLVDFYAGYGFVATGPEFLDDGIPHVPMRRSPRVEATRS